jgi:hypothetical protein
MVNTRWIAGLSLPFLLTGTAWAVEFDSAFWKHWGDGKAELAAYDLVYPRYGEPRTGRAVSIFVTETFGNARRVKAERPQGGGERFPVMKLNLVQDFPTGVYDYNVMTSAFVALEPVNGRPAGTPTKISFSSQEWCGHVYAQALFDERALRFDSHSYFDEEADERRELEFPAGGLAQDALPFWARGWSGPRLNPGESREVPLLRSFEAVRLEHRPLVWERATLRRGPAAETIRVPAGEFEVERYTAEIGRGADRRVWTWFVEKAAPQRIVRWSHDGGLEANLRGSKRLAYWQMSGRAFERAVAEFGY